MFCSVFNPLSRASVSTSPLLPLHLSVSASAKVLCGWPLSFPLFTLRVRCPSPNLPHSSAMATPAPAPAAKASSGPKTNMVEDFLLGGTTTTQRHADEGRADERRQRSAMEERRGDSSGGTDRKQQLESRTPHRSSDATHRRRVDPPRTAAVAHTNDERARRSILLCVCV